ncbi:uncharacterized protein TRAVEDRAFT_49753 [Trametes versicolor FP-101664 SS1]|uniref:uncharacterized protein n=1 Tax=Trametes versicolor (strain FP-101664) TaxID=717944 RepID=UPI0004621434|nr:uncharacterized protein TRAVEDRAFT_49753 [Trametes versicolor FP-101664 SS1]EIW56942.1 hypothetical protein TRAVEDRAFT_49753 [Trametes versicolor FP-101664 SS1]
MDAAPNYDSYGLMVVHQELTTFIVALFLEAFLFGAFTITYTMGAWSLLTTLASRRSSMRDWVLLSASTTMFALALAHLALSLKLTLVGFVNNAGSLYSVDNALSGASLWYSTLGAPRFGIYVTQTLIGDAFMIYRLFLVWNRSRKVIILPIILCTLDGVSGYLGITPSFVIVPLAFLFFSFISNTLCSALIMWRVLRNTNQYMPLSARLGLLWKVVEAIVQSAAIYSLASIALLVTFFISPNIGFTACAGVFPPLIGLVFSFIVLRLARSSADHVARLPVHPQDRGTEMRRRAIPLPFGVPPHTPPFPPPRFRLPTLDFSGDAQALESLTTSTSSIKPLEMLLRSDSSLDDARGPDPEVGGRPREGDLGVLDICAEKLAWKV